MVTTKAVIFDLGRVIVPFDFNRAYQRVAARTGDTLETVAERARNSGLAPEYEAGRLGSRDFAVRMCESLGLDASFDEFCDIWNCVFLPEPLVPESLLQGLAARYPLVLLSNTNEIHFEMLRVQYPLLRHFHRFTLSYEVGAMKPEDAIYRAAVENCGVAPGECFFTDDIPDYVDAARRFGIDAVQFHSAGQIEAELRNRGLSWDQ